MASADLTNHLTKIGASASWLDRDPARLAASLQQFVGNPAYGLQDLRADLERFVFLLDGSDGEQLFGRHREPAPAEATTGGAGSLVGAQRVKPLQCRN